MDPSGVFIAGIHIPTKTIEAMANATLPSTKCACCAMLCNVVHAGLYWSFISTKLIQIAMIHAVHISAYSSIKSIKFYIILSYCI